MTSKRVKARKYSIPTKKTTNNCNRNTSVLAKLITCASGSIKIATSVRIFGTVLPIRMLLRLIHVPLPSLSASQARSIGVHWKMVTKRMAVDHVQMKQARTRQEIFMLRLSKARVYMKR